MYIFYKIERLYYNIKNYISNSIYYSSFLCEDRHWDYGGFYKLIELKFQAYYDIINNKETCWHVLNKNEKRNVKTVVELAKRLEEDNYIDYDAMGVYINKNIMDSLKVEIICDDRKKSDRIYNHGTKRKEYDKELLFKYLNKYIEYWWD